ncbi:nuclear receptor-binding protein-like [Limulus polyphemus]|uniref:Nuclear receptor-binding protein-like n=1 Tax=Limulus polyphemus TaxID=6850 RepID=A0ABM1BT19_LIMPO|nr:nuclear receptor-binding protein-like [Limulus polyphemus]
MQDSLGSKGGNKEDVKNTKESGDDSEDESEILEESPCGRWLKRREEVQQRDIPGIDSAYLAMDTEDGVEVVWNEVKFSERKSFKPQEEKIRQVFDNLTQLEHPNIVKFHKYWMDTDSENPRVIFISEYMSSGSLKQFLKKTKRNVKKFSLKAWKRWCTQILSALSYLHSCSPPIIHGNLTCDTIFIQHDGLVKIGSVAPDAIHRHVKTWRQDISNVHFIAPEFGISVVTPAVDIYSFGICALEMAALIIPGNGDSGTQITSEVIKKTIESLEDPLQKDFIRRCLSQNPAERPKARELLFHPLIFEVHSLCLLTANTIVNHASFQPDQLTDEAFKSRCSKNNVIGEIQHKDGRPGVIFCQSDAPKLELEKLLEDVRNGIYPLTAFAMPQPPVVRPRPCPPAASESVKSSSPEVAEVETRRIVTLMCNMKPQESGQNLLMTLLLQMDDKIHRQLSCEVTSQDTSGALAGELVHYGFINKGDHGIVASLIEDTFSRYCIPEATGTSVTTTLPLQAVS